MEVRVWSIPRTAAEAARWPAETDVCPRCGEPFGPRKMRREGQAVVHKTCPTLLWPDPARQMPVRIQPKSGLLVLDTKKFGLLYTATGTPLARPAETDDWPLWQPDLTFSCLFDWQRYMRERATSPRKR